MDSLTHRYIILYIHILQTGEFPFLKFQLHMSDRIDSQFL